MRDIHREIRKVRLEGLVSGLEGCISWKIDYMDKFGWGKTHHFFIYLDYHLLLWVIDNILWEACVYDYPFCNLDHNLLSSKTTCLKGRDSLVVYLHLSKCEVKLWDIGNWLLFNLSSPFLLKSYSVYNLCMWVEALNHWLLSWVRIVVQRLDLFSNVYDLIEPFKVSLNLWGKCPLIVVRTVMVKRRWSPCSMSL